MEGLTTWAYDTASHGIGKLHTVTAAEGKDESYSYDALGRPLSTTVTIDATAYTSSQSYDLDGRLDTLTYPASVHYPLGLTIRHVYNAWGYLSEIRNDASNALFWQADSQNAAGQLTQATAGNGITTGRSYDPQTGRISAIGSSTPTGTLDIQDLSYTFDTLGNLTQRRDNTQVLTEDFVYDVLNRMLSSTLDDGATQTTKSTTYNAIGNILSKTGIGTYSYGVTAGPHAVTSAGGKSYSYDANGNQLQGWHFTTSQSRAQSWTSYNKPAQITQGTSILQFSYGADRRRFKQVITGGSTRLYINNRYEKDDNAGFITHIHYIQAAGATVALYKSKSDNSEETRYLHRDHLGSITAITDENAQLVEQLAYDPHGKRRNIDWSDALAQIYAQETERSFTGHRYLDDVGLIHMGGRTYDPDLGRFLSADPFIQEPANPQSLNRYTYVLNNPLSYTDPSGFFFGKLFKGVVKGVFRAGGKVLKNKVVRTAIAIAIAVEAPFLAGNIYANGFAAGFVGSGGDPKAAIVGAATAGAFGAVGGIDNAFVKVVAHGAVGGISSELQGGKFVSGFLSAGTVQAFAPGINGLDTGNKGTSFFRTAAAAAVGGTASVLGGGKFANGAVTAAFAYTFADAARGFGEGGSPSSGTASGSPLQANPNRIWENPTGGQVRGCDPRGCGGYGADRSYGPHQGADYVATPGQNVVAVTDGIIDKIGYPYANDLSYRYTRITTPDGYVVRQLYVFPAAGISAGASVSSGQTIGRSQGLGTRYPGITEHVHVDIRHNGQLINPTTLISSP